MKQILLSIFFVYYVKMNTIDLKLRLNSYNNYCFSGENKMSTYLFKHINILFNIVFYVQYLLYNTDK